MSAEKAAPLEDSPSAASLAALAELAVAGHDPPLRRMVLSNPESLLAFLESEAAQVRRQIAARRHLESEQLRRLKLQALAELAAGAAHEINNPLAVISGQAQHLLKSEESLERAKALERIIAQCKRIHGVLTDLMFFARPPQPQKRTVRVSKIVDGVLKGLGRLALERQIELKRGEVPPRLMLQADPDMLGRALTGLLANALEAAPTDGWTRLSVRSVAGAVEFLIEDNGPGLGPTEREHLFDPFFSGRSAGRGAGLGLSKVWRIAELHGGQVHFVSEPGQPTRFLLSLPGPSNRNGHIVHPRHASERSNGRNGKLHRPASRARKKTP
jgi:signal transduction histidine kinase